jgi:hypothetical protein
MTVNKMKTKEKITVYDYTDAIHGGIAPVKHKQYVKKYEVEAWCLQGQTGFVAYFYMGDTLYEAHGDDGHWRLVGRMHKHWLKELKETVNSIEEI